MNMQHLLVTLQRHQEVGGTVSRARLGYSIGSSTRRLLLLLLRDGTCGPGPGFIIFRSSCRATVTEAGEDEVPWLRSERMGGGSSGGNLTLNHQNAAWESGEPLPSRAIADVPCGAETYLAFHQYYGVHFPWQQLYGKYCVALHASHSGGLCARLMKRQSSSF